MDNVGKPSKGILKTSSSFDKQEKAKKYKSTKWDEMNIMATFHPADKDYGHMKIEEPKTPYYTDIPEEADGASKSKGVDPDVLRSKLAGAVAGGSSRRSMTPEDESDDDEDKDLDDGERAKKREFRNRRKQHYNEFKVAQLAKKLMEEDDDDEDEDDSKKKAGSNTVKKNPSRKSNAKKVPKQKSKSVMPSSSSLGQKSKVGKVVDSTGPAKKKIFQKSDEDPLPEKDLSSRKFKNLRQHM